MSKKTAYIVIIAFVVLALAGFLVFYFYTHQGQGSGIGETETRGNIFPSSGTGTTPTKPAEPADTAPTTSVGEGQAVALVKELSLRPSAGAVAIATSSGETLVRFIERTTGNVYEVNPERTGESRLSNTTLPKIEEALWNKTGTKVLARYAGDNPDTIKTYAATLSKSADRTEGELKGTYLTENIRAVAKNPDQTRVFYLLNHSAGSTGILSDFDGSKKTQIFDSPLSELNIDWPSPSLIALTTKGAAGVAGYMYLLNANTGELSRAVSGIAGLSTLVNPNGSLLLYSETTATGLSLKIHSFKDGSVQEVSVATLPEKCVWSKKDVEIIYCSVPSRIGSTVLPDSWYKGLVSLSDDIWRIDAANGTAKLVAKLKPAANADIDGTGLFLSPNENYLFITNKNDFHLWSVRLVP